VSGHHPSSGGIHSLLFLFLYNTLRLCYYTRGSGFLHLLDSDRGVLGTQMIGIRIELNGVEDVTKCKLTTKSLAWSFLVLHLPYTTWRTLNRLRVGVSRCKKNLGKWGYSNDEKCDRGEIQDEAHLLGCNNIGTTCTISIRAASQPQQSQNGAVANG
jgi:hypothetical protein